MTKSGWHDDDASPFKDRARGILPLVVIIFLTLVQIVPFTAGNFGEIRPNFLLMVAFYLAILRPHALSPLVLFLLGIFVDFMTGTIVGLTPCLLVATSMVTASQRRLFLSRSFAVIWWGFLVILGFSGLVQFLAFSLYAGAFVPLWPLIAQGLVSALCFPFIMPLLHFSYR